MARPRKDLIARRVQVRLSKRHAELFDCYTTDQISQILSKALDVINLDCDLGIIEPSILRPSNASTSSIARVSINSKTIQILLPEKIESFREMVKTLRYKWIAPFWTRTFNYEAVVADRAAELCYRTLGLGIPVQVNYSVIKAKIISGKFKIESVKTIKVITDGVYKNWFAFSWPKGEDYYNKVISLTAAKYVDGSVIVPPEHFLEVEDFAEVEGFDISVTARSVIEESKKQQEIELLINVRSIGKRHTKRKKIAETEVPDHLKDNPS